MRLPIILLQADSISSTTVATILVAVFVFFVLALWLIPKWQLSPWKGVLKNEDFVDQQNNARATLAQILGGSFVLASLFFTGESLKNSQEALRVSEKGQINERFTKAIEHLGKADDSEKNENNLTTRLGGIFALEQIAKNSADDYHWPIMQILTAYVREKSSWKEDGDIRDPEQIPKEVQAIMSVIGWRARTYMKGEGDTDRRLDLHGTDLRGLALKGGAHLEGANLDRAHLEGALLREIHLEGALLTNASLRGTNLFRARLSGAVLQGADLDQADLMSSDITAEQLASAINWDRAKNVPQEIKDAARARSSP